MTDTPRRQLVITPPAGIDDGVGRWIWALEDVRRRTLGALDGLDEAALDWSPDEQAHSIATLLYHIAAIEADWLYAEVLELEAFPEAAAALFPHDVAGADGRLTRIAGESLVQHRARLDAIRANVLDAVGGMSLEEFRRPRSLAAYDVTPEWVVYHLVQHESEHGGEILRLRRLLNSKF